MLGRSGLRRPRVGVLICVLQFSKGKKHNSHGDYYHYMLALTDKHVGDEPSIGGPLAMLIEIIES